MSFNKEHFLSLLKLAIEHNASDIHIRSNETPSLRIRGDLVPVETKTLTKEDVVSICKIIFQDTDFEQKFEQISEIDGGVSIKGICRLRYNFFRYQGQQIGIIFRIIKSKILSTKELGLPRIINQIALASRGLILVSGATGSGKSTTLAAMVDHINENNNCHIITLEDPIEFIHTSKKSRITQREVGIDTPSFTKALTSALRQDPDVILIGELRDQESIQIALKAAETGHTVLGTVHTTDAVATIGRLISMFSPQEQAEVRKRLAENLYATIGQRMLKGIEPGKVFVASEIMISSPGIKECILGKTPLEKINYFISSSDTKDRGAKGTQSFDDHIYKLFKKGFISKQTAVEAATTPSDLLQRIMLAS